MAHRKRIWIVSELYYPELTSTGYFLTGIAEGLASKYDVSVLCGQPTYWVRGVRAPVRETRNGVDVLRCRATTLDKDKLIFRIINLFTVSISISVAAMFRIKRGDVVIAVTNPPLIPYLIALVCRLKGSRFILLIHDVYPDVLMRLGILSPQSFFAHLMNRASRWLYSRASRIIVLGRDMQKLVCAKLNSGRERIVIATNWGDTEAIVPQSFTENQLLDKLNLKQHFVVQYCGNIGRTHGMNNIANAAEAIASDPEFHFLVIGWGAMRRWLVQQKKERQLENLTILDPLPQMELCDGLNACNVAIITFSSGMAGISVPSRMYNVLAAGKPLLAVCDDDSELAAVVREEGIGWVVPPGRADLIVATLYDAKSNPERLRSMGERARKASEAKYNSDYVLQIYESIIESLRSE
jgi:glycosyltransferase involved in cell wall biosynthesis